MGQSQYFASSFADDTIVFYEVNKYRSVDASKLGLLLVQSFVCQLNLDKSDMILVGEEGDVGELAAELRCWVGGLNLSSSYAENTLWYH